ncbi:MAG TPA: hypothetical protein VGQ64_01430 [Candidatus Limnocylindrales bacterium]|jgi:hypothetical protein|nr:hypothetical protein [Candidatus Limnocylindrales bacterium]
MRHVTLPIAAAIVVAATFAGCVGNAGDAAQLRRQANAALARWADAVAVAGGPSPVVLVGELTGQVGDWEEAVGENNKVALMAGRVEADANLPAEVPPDGEVRWPDGFTASVALVSAQQALAAIQAGAEAPCSECASLRITASRLTTGSIETSRGPATVPIWEYTAQGTAVKVTRVAIAHPITVAPPPWDANKSPAGLAIDSASGSVAGRELTVTFVGAPLPADQPCGEDYTAEAIESDLAVVVIVTRHPHGGFGFGACTLAGAVRTATAELAAPLGERAVLEVQQGLPVPVALTP